MVFVGNNSPMHADFCIRVNCNHGDFKQHEKKWDSLWTKKQKLLT